MKWYREYRPKVHYWLHTTLLCLDLLLAVFFIWAGKRTGISMTFEIIALTVLALMAYGFTRVWGHWIDNPDEYEKLHKARPGRLGRRDEVQDKKKKTRKK